MIYFILAFSIPKMLKNRYRVFAKKRLENFGIFSCLSLDFSWGDEHALDEHENMLLEACDITIIKIGHMSWTFRFLTFEKSFFFYFRVIGPLLVYLWTCREETNGQKSFEKLVLNRAFYHNKPGHMSWTFRFLNFGKSVIFNFGEFWPMRKAKVKKKSKGPSFER